MSDHAIHILSYSPDLLVEFDLPPGTHARIGASPKAEVTLPLTGIPPFSYMIGRFQDGRLFLADPDGVILRRVDLPDTLSLPPYQFVILDPADSPHTAILPEASIDRKNSGPLKIFPLALGVVVALALAAGVAVSQCGRPAIVPRPAPPVPSAQAGKPTPVPPAPVGAKKAPAQDTPATR